MTARIALVLLVSACGGASTKPAKPVSKADEGGCRPAYEEYERRWRVARTQELADFPDAFSPQEIEEIVSDEIEMLPSMDDIRTLRLMYALVAVFAPDAPWVVAFDASERAIAACGERAHRPT